MCAPNHQMKQCPSHKMASEQHPLSLRLLVFLTFLPLPTIAQTHRNISLGSSLTTQQNTSWTSLSADFAFGFQQIEEDGFLLAIWFNKIPERTIVWSANGQNLSGRGSKVELTLDGHFWLKDPSGNQIWNPNIQVSHAALLDTGNFVLVGEDHVIKWQSFGHPTDTILPGQVLTQGSGFATLVSRYQERNFTSGRFQFTLQNDGNLVLFTRHFPLDSTNFAYWETNVHGNNFKLVFNQSGTIQCSNGSITSIISSNASSTKDFYQRAILEYDGVFRHYVYPKSSTGSKPRAWTTSSFKPPNICLNITWQLDAGACGYNSFCTYDGRKRCYCPAGYTLVDPTDVMKGCKPDFVSQSCDEAFPETHLFDLYDMPNTDWTYSDYEAYESVREDWCRQACLDDCYCDVAVFVNGRCVKKMQPLRNGRRDSTIGGKALIKIRKDHNSTLKPDDVLIVHEASSSKLTIIGSVLVSSSGLLFLLAVCFAASRFGHRNSKEQEPSLLMTGNGMNLTSFTYEELSKATNGFNEEVGRGAVARVYKGVMSGANPIAVKNISNMLRGRDEEFKAEVSAIGQTNHRNLVQLIGFCDEGEHRLLVYEFMSNGSLANFLFGAQRPRWYQRKEIALAIGRGLSYLHDECRTQIIHCDIKPQNILLDDSYTARISDFGLAKLLMLDQTRTTTAIRGTKGYVAPEWFRNIPVSAKVDVYSYGILLLELICCRKNFDANPETDDLMILADWAYDSFKDGNVCVLVEDDVEALDDMKKVERYLMIAIWCIQEDPTLRPTMKKVLLMLEGSVDVPIPPDPDIF